MLSCSSRFLRCLAHCIKTPFRRKANAFRTETLQHRRSTGLMSRICHSSDLRAIHDSPAEKQNVSVRVIQSHPISAINFIPIKISTALASKLGILSIR